MKPVSVETLRFNSERSCGDSCSCSGNTEEARGRVRRPAPKPLRDDRGNKPWRPGVEVKA